MENVQEYFRKNRDEHLRQLKEFLSIPSISSLSVHKEDVQKCAEWLADQCRSIGLENVRVFPTKGHPVVYADWLHAEGAPIVLIYGHYDVQPVDPLDLWETPPFEPVIRDEKIYARGSSDDKGQVFMHIKTLEALLETEGKLPVNVKLIIEGEEEIGSPHLPEFVEEHQQLLAADCLVISDTDMIAEGRPSICYGLRGLAGLQIDLTGPKKDLHSGQYGGGVQNPAHALAELIASFHDEKGRVAVEGFYDRVAEISEAERKALAALDLDEEEIRKELGVPELYGEEGYTYVERTSVRPTLEVNGMFSGFQDEGIKTVLPAKATAKITCRLVPDQDPEEILQLIEKHIEKHLPKGVTYQVTRFDKGEPFVTPLDHPAIQAAARAYEKVYKVPVTFTRSGGSIPIVATFHKLLNLPVVLMGFGLPSENVHSPNEHFHLENFDKGLLTLSIYWHELNNSLR